MYLTEEVLPSLGFGEILDERLHQSMKMGLEKIELKVRDQQPSGEYLYNVVLEKQKVNPEDPERERRYYANRVEVTFKMNGEKEARQHTFGLYKQKGLPLNQMRNLMKGNYVHNSYWKEGVQKQRWQYVDFSKTTEEGVHPMKSIWADSIEWNLAKELSALPHVNALSADVKEDLLRAMKNGDNVAASIKMDGSRQNVMLRANPKKSAIEIFKPDGEKISLGKKTGLSVVNDGQMGSKNLKAASELVTDAFDDDSGSKKKVKRG